METCEEMRRLSIWTPLVYRLLPFGYGVTTDQQGQIIQQELINFAVFDRQRNEKDRLLLVQKIGSDIFRFLEKDPIINREMAINMVAIFLVIAPQRASALCKLVGKSLNRDSWRQSSRVQAFVFGIVRAFTMINRRPELEAMKSSLTRTVVESWATSMLELFFLEERNGIKILNPFDTVGSREEDELGQFFACLRDGTFGQPGQLMMRDLVVRANDLSKMGMTTHIRSLERSFFGQLVDQLTMKHLAVFPSLRRLGFCAECLREVSPS